jgi:outer membrane lipoprotein-sorting protein
MKNNFIKIITVFFLLLASTNFYGQDAVSLLKKMDDVLYFAKDKQSDVTLKMINLKSGKVTEKKAQMFEKGDKKLFRYVSPPPDSGIATLTLPGNETYLYLPLFNVVKRIKNTSSVDNLNKSDFSLSDRPEKNYSSAYTPEMVGENDTSYVLKLKPKTESKGYKYLIVYVDKKYYYPNSIEYYDNNGDKLKTAYYHFIKQSGHWIADKIEMVNNQKKSKTTTIMSNIKINKGIDESVFTVENLKKKK